MLAAIFIEVVPEAVILWTKGTSTSVEADHGLLGAMTLLLGGYLLIHFFEHTIAPHFHFGEETHPEAVVRPSAAYTALGGLSIHTFFDGASVASAFVVDRKVGLLVFVAVLLHKVPEGFTAASIMLASGRSAGRAVGATLIIGAATLVGVLSVAILQARVAEAVVYALPFSAGVTLYVAASDLIPEVNHLEGKNPFVSLVVFAGVAFFYVMHRLIEH
jgi:zinc transporter ZupT